MKNFRNLTAQDVELRIGQVKKDSNGKVMGYSLLLYKNARVDMQILDATVGFDHWQKQYKEVNGNLYCSVGIRVDDEWIWKEDCGVCGNANIEMSAKGAASDAFKRACFAWGIGRELYTSPFVWVKSDDIYAHYSVSKLDVQDNEIVALEIQNSKDKNVVFRFEKKQSMQKICDSNALNDYQTLKTANEVLQFYKDHQVEIENDATLKNKIISYGKELRRKELAA